MTGRMMAVVAALALVAGCAAMGPKGVTVLEMEEATLTKAAVKDLAGASGGKAVLLTDESSEVTVTANLKKGAYEVTFYGVAPSYDEDAFYVRIGDGEEMRLVISDIAKLLPSKPVKFSVDKDGPCKILISFAEENVQLDRVEIKAVK